MVCGRDRDNVGPNESVKNESGFFAANFFFRGKDKEEMKISWFVVCLREIVRWYSELRMFLKWKGFKRENKLESKRKFSGRDKRASSEDIFIMQKGNLKVF